MQEPSTLPPRGPRRRRRDGQTPLVLPGSKSPAKVQSGFPQELGRSRRLRRKNTSARAGRTATARARRPGVQAGGSESRTHRRHRQAKETKRGGTDGGKSQRPDSTGEAREPRHTRGGPRGGKRGVGSRDLRKETRRMHGNPDSVSTKRRRIAELAARAPQMGFTSLAYLIDLDWLYEAW